MYPRRSQVGNAMRQYGLVPDRGVVSLLIVLTVIWLVARFGGDAVRQAVMHLIMTPVLAIGREPWQLVTAAFIDLRFGDILMATVTLLFFGNQVERTLGAVGLWKVFIIGGFGAMLAAGLMGRLIEPYGHLFGSNIAATSMLTAFAALAGRARVRSVVFGDVRPATMAWIWLAISAIFIIASPVDGETWQGVVIGLCALGGAAAAGWLVGGGRGNITGNSIDRLRAWRLRRRYRVLQGGRDGKRYLN